MYKKILSYLLLIAIALMVFNTTTNRHTHKLENGTIIIHAHPFQNSDSEPIKNHKHSNSEISYLCAIYLIFIIILVGVFALLLENKKSFSLFYEIYKPLLNSYNLHKSLRAPPTIA